MGERPERMSGCYEHMNEEWKKTAKVLLGSEPGDLADYEKWLISLKQPMLRKFSSISGNGVVFASTDYAPDSKVIALEEAPEKTRFQLNINEIKDIDSLINACREQVFYSGNIVLGNSAFVEGSSSVSDSFYVYNSARIHASKNIACSTIMRNTENMFGCNISSFSKYVVRCHQHGKGVRDFECCLCWLASDCYYSYNIQNCTNCMFSFNLRSRRNAIGNLVLPSEKYQSIKARILEQVVSELERKKSAPSLFDIINQCGLPREEEIKPLSRFARPKKEATPGPLIEKAFSETAKIVLGKPLGPMEQYAPWLKSRVLDVGEATSALGSGNMAIISYENIKSIKPGRFVTLEESLLLGEKLALSQQEVEKLDLSSASRMLGKIAFLSPGMEDGTITSVTHSPVVLDSSNCHSVLGCVNLKNSAYSVWPNGSDHVFGSAFLYNSLFSIKCYSSYGLSSCFEVDTSSDSTHSYFCHNVENVHESMFCFNAKNLNYAVWNQPVGRAAYLKLKGMLKSWLLEKLEREKKVDLDVFSLGSRN
ncbi:MAG: hypothetical protein PHS02_03315 [Candidatus ainarchaeum sp.]|nr:hypothetical protein [Candidatus ainarchaeum sp.]